MTGILPLARYDTQSALNNFTEFTMVNPGPFAKYYGFTEEEVAKICEEHHLDPVKQSFGMKAIILVVITFTTQTLLQNLLFAEHF